MIIFKIKENCYKFFGCFGGIIFFCFRIFGDLVVIVGFFIIGFFIVFVIELC